MPAHLMCGLLLYADCGESTHEYGNHAWSTEMMGYHITKEDEAFVESLSKEELVEYYLDLLAEHELLKVLMEQEFV